METDLVNNFCTINVVVLPDLRKIQFLQALAINVVAATWSGSWCDNFEQHMGDLPGHQFCSTTKIG